MPDKDRILTLHPQGKAGVNIEREKYNTIRNFILRTLREHDEISFEDLTDLAVSELTPTFDGKVIWYVVTVKLDLEARGMIARVPGTSPHRLTLSP